MKTQLPEKYYLDHFNEFLHYIVGRSEHLLTEAHTAFIQRFNQLSNDAQCLLVRFLNRNVPMIDQDTLRYSEISDLPLALQTLSEQGFIRRVNEGDWSSCLRYLTKPQLLEILDSLDCPAKASSKKAVLVEALTNASKASHQVLLHPILASFWVNASNDVIDYFLFLYFGNLNRRLNQFSLRDLGVIQTSTQNSTVDVETRARFTTREEALSGYFYARTLKTLEKPQTIDLERLAQHFDTLPKPVGRLAKGYFNTYTLKLGRWLENEDESLALRVLSVCELPEAEERQLRLLYKLGNKDVVQQRLEALIQEESSEHLLTFAEDFLARKFNKKRTSQFTDVIRSASVVSVDEQFRHHVELGVCNHYRAQGIEAYETENDYWRTLFGLVFWEELFGDKASLCNEFDRLPAYLLDGSFYDRYASAIKEKSQYFERPEHTVNYLLSMATRHYGKVNGLVHWSPEWMDILKQSLAHLAVQSVWKILILMAKDFPSFRDGFPDLMVIEQGVARFEEVKAPGDSLRKNQLVVLNRLQAAGIDANVIRVEWAVDPNQPYTVIDIETTGGKKDRDRITEIGAVKMVAGEEVARWQSLVNPQRSIPAFITELTGISNDMVQDAPLFDDIATSLADFLAGSIFVAHNANFDYGFIKAEFARLNQKFSMPKLCTVKEMKRYYPGHESYGLAKLSKCFDITLEQHHRALSDALAAAELLKLVNKKRTV